MSRGSRLKAAFTRLARRVLDQPFYGWVERSEDPCQSDSSGFFI
jgi:hypothetical protein